MSGMALSSTEDQGEGRNLFRRQGQGCDDGIPISTRYETSTITTYYVTYSQFTPPPRSSEPPPETSRPPPTSSRRIHYTLTLQTLRPEITIRPTTSTTRLPPKKSVVSTSTDIIPKARAVTGVPVTITRTIVTRIPVETIYSCPPAKPEPPTTRDDDPTSRSTRVPPSSWEPPTSSSREPPTSRSSRPPISWVEPTSRPGREPSSSWDQPTSWSTNTTEPSSTSRTMTSSDEPWFPSSSTPSTPTSRTRPTGPTSTSPPPTSPPPSTRPTSSIPPPTSSAPNSTVTWPPTTTSPPYSECVYTLYDGTVPYGNYMASCTESSTSGPWCTSFHSNGEWDLVPCTSTYTNTSSTTSTLTNTTSSTQTITSWPCSSFDRSWDAWVGVPCTSSINVTSSTWACSSYAFSREAWVPVPCSSTTTSSIERCSEFVGSRSGWIEVPCTSTPNITSTSSLTSTPPTITTVSNVTITPTITSRPCSTYVEDMRTWLPVPCNTTTPTLTIIPTTIIITPTITRPPISHTQHCSVYIPELDIWVSTPCTTASPTPSMCLNEDLDMWVPCTSVPPASETDILIETTIATSGTTPIVTTITLPPHTPSTRPAHTPFPTITSIESEEPTLTEDLTQTSEPDTHTTTWIQTSQPSSSLATEAVTSPHEDPSSSPEIGASSIRATSPPSTRPADPTSRESVTMIVITSHEPSRPPPSTRPPQPPSSRPILISTFIPPTPSNRGVIMPVPSSTITTTPDGIQGGALAGVIVGSILGVVGLLGLGAFIMKSFGGPRGRDLFGPRAGYQAAHDGGSIGGRDGGGGGGSDGMSESRNESPLRPALRNRNMAGGGDGWGNTFSQPYIYGGVAAVAGAAATTANNQRGRDSGASGRYGDGGIRDEETPDATTQRYADGGISGPDSHYDTGISDRPYGNQDPRYIISSSDVQFDPYHDLPARQDSVPGGGNITRQSAITTPEISLSHPGSTQAQAYQSTLGNVASGYPVSALQHTQPDTGVFLSAAGGTSTTSFAPSSIDQTHQAQAPAPANMYLSSLPYSDNAGTGAMMSQSPEPMGIQRPPYWEGTVPAASVDSLPQHGNIPRYSAFTEVGNSIGIGSSPAPAFNNTPGMGNAPAPTPGTGGTVGMGGAPQSSGIVSPTWNPIGVTEFGRSIIGSPGAHVDTSVLISSSAAPDAPRGLHQGLTRLTTELAGAQERDLDTSSPRSASSIRPPRVGGPRSRPPRPPRPRVSIPRPESSQSLPPAYEEQQRNT